MKRHPEGTRTMTEGLLGKPEGESKSRWCPWCHQEVKKLERHHCPIPESLGGRETEEICHRCHMKDESLIRKLISEIKGGKTRLFGEDPYAERRKILEEAMRLRKGGFLKRHPEGTRKRREGNICHLNGFQRLVFMI